MKKTDLTFIGIDCWDRPVYRDTNGKLWKDFEGEPDMPIEMTYPDFE